MTTFAELDLIEPLVRALADENYETPTPIQLAAIPPVLAGRDLLACAQTGTGKTAAFSLPVLQRLSSSAPASGGRKIRCLVLSPTRELAAQIGERFTAYGKYLGLRNTVIFGGVGQNPQIDAIRRGVDVLVATPGRLLDLIDQRHVVLDRVEYFVLDEADRMLDMGFIRDVRKILPLLPVQRQNLLFSATMPQPIVELASAFLKNPARVEVTPPATTVERIAQSVMFVSKNEKKNLLASMLRQGDLDRTIVFTRTKHGANKLVEDLGRAGFRAAAIHGNKSQGARVAALEGFRDGSIPVLVATDVASRGLDIDDVSHVINFDLPNEPESYVHRIGRTARAGRSGSAIAFCDEHESTFLRDIERTTRQSIPRVLDHPFHCQAAVPGDPGNQPPPPLGRQQQPQGGRGGRGAPQGNPRRPSPPAFEPRAGGSSGGEPRPGGQAARSPQGSSPRPPQNSSPRPPSSGGGGGGGGGSQRMPWDSGGGGRPSQGPTGRNDGQPNVDGSGGSGKRRRRRRSGSANPNR